MYEYFSIYQQKTALKPLLIPKPHEENVFDPQII